ncbi:fungal-specific transcription factor domain-containing protein [Xylariales sp. PMI_506]|nr:fungal-specific transcription factor domain-containing protein [Xylariales sp. PMI_506]
MASEVSHSPVPQGSNTSTPYKRASRKGAPKKFACTEPDCGKVYTRAEHLQRHQLNHNPKKVYSCTVGDCNQEFVRYDLLERHRKRHSASYVPRNRASTSFNLGSSKSTPPSIPLMSPSPSSGNAAIQPPPVAFPQSAPRNASVLLSPTSNHAQTTSSSVPPHDAAPPMASSSSWMDPANDLRSKQPSYYGPPQVVNDLTSSSYVPYHGMPAQVHHELNFAMWLFDTQRSFSDFGGMTGMPFLDGGLESTFNNNILYENDTLGSRSHLDPTPPRQLDMLDELLSEYRRQEIVGWIRSFCHKNNAADYSEVALLQEVASDLPAVSLEMLRDCLRQFWDAVAPRLPIVHQPTFSPSRCSIYLLLVMISLGAASLNTQDSSGNLKEYKVFADLIITNARWEILTTEGATPPVDLGVAQALLLLEFYEKMFSTRKLHERANIYHSATLTLLRRGSPLIGRSGSESPPEPSISADQIAAFDARSRWTRWADTEAMHRVVFVAFMMDVAHAAMFGHVVDMAPHEIRLPLPCDDSLWCALTPEITRQMDANLQMYDVKPISFLAGLKRAIHGDEVKTHSFGRMIIMCGLLSVAWHLIHRETHLESLELSTSSSNTQEKRCRMLLSAFNRWKTSFDKVMGATGTGHQPGSNGPIQDAALLYHLAHISLYVKIVDCQVYAGAKRLLGRKISTQDYKNVVQRMKTWACQPTTRHAVLHAFKLLYHVLVDTDQNQPYGYENGGPRVPHGTQYSCRTDLDPHRPWIVYYATLSIWSFVRALSYGRPPTITQAYSSQMRQTANVTEYLAKIARLEELDTATAATLHDGLPALLDLIGSLAAQSPSEILQEAHSRLEQCKMLSMTGAP